MSLMTRWTKTKEIVAINWITLQALASRQTLVTLIELRIVNETFSTRVTRSTKTEISLIIETEGTSAIRLTEVVVSENKWDGWINI